MCAAVCKEQESDAASPWEEDRRTNYLDSFIYLLLIK